MVSERKYADPAIDVEARPFWDATAEGVFRLKRCRSCQATHYYPRSICPHCFSDDTEWYEASGRAVVYAFSVARKAEPPYVIAYVTLAEGVTIMSNIVECDPDTVHIGQALELTFRKTEGGHTLPVFRPADAPSRSANA